MTSTSRPLIGLTATTCPHPKSGAPLEALNRRYIEAIYDAGGIPVLIPTNLPHEAAAALLTRLDGLLLTGGGDIDPAQYGGQAHEAVHEILPARDAMELTLTKIAVAEGIPFLGVCRGLQVVNVALGGTLYEDIPSQYRRPLKHSRNAVTERTLLTHTVKIAKNSRVRRLLGAEEIEVNSLHHQGIRALAEGLEAVAWSSDGLIEAVELPDHPFGIAVQWHPEWLYREHPIHQALFCGLVGAAAAHKGT